MRQLTMAVAAVVVAVAAAAIVVFLWLRAYAPLSATRPYQPGTGLGADVEPTYGSGGKTVYIPVYRRGAAFGATFTLGNGGRFAVTVLGIDPEQPGPLTPTAVTAGLRLDPRDSAVVSARWRLDCAKSQAEVTTDRLRIRYRYLSIFTRTQTVVLPFAVTLRCHGGPSPSP